MLISQLEELSCSFSGLVGIRGWQCLSYTCARASIHIPTPTEGRLLCANTLREIPGQMEKKMQNHHALYLVYLGLRRDTHPPCLLE